MNSEASIDLSGIFFQEVIGIFPYGNIYKVRYSKTEKNCECRIFKTPQSDEFPNYLNKLSKINHNSIQKLIGFSMTDFNKKANPVILTELFQNGTLKQLIRYKNIFSLNDTLKQIIIYGIAKAMSYLHSNYIVNTNLNPSNIFLDDFLLPKIGNLALSNFNDQISKENILKNKENLIYMSP